MDDAAVNLRNYQVITHKYVSHVTSAKLFGGAYLSPIDSADFVSAWIFGFFSWSVTRQIL